MYGHPEGSKKDLTWQLIRYLNQGNNLPWLLRVDFNEILRTEEKGGGLPKDRMTMERFKETINDCNIKDINYKGPFFTWCNR